LRAADFHLHRLRLVVSVAFALRVYIIGQGIKGQHLYR
jgi:hypothetical protein